MHEQKKRTTNNNNNNQNKHPHLRQNVADIGGGGSSSGEDDGEGEEYFPPLPGVLDWLVWENKTNKKQMYEPFVAYTNAILRIYIKNSLIYNLKDFIYSYCIYICMELPEIIIKDITKPERPVKELLIFFR